MKAKIATLFALTAVASILWQGALAADTPPPPSPPSPPPARAAAAAPADKLAEARKQIAAKQWPAAIEALKRVNDTGSAVWNNLMGYSLRKGATPDLAASEKYYDAALRIDPHHRDTLEYSGELCLMKGELDKAQARLATLATECASKCEQYGDLKSAIERYKAAGNKFVATTSW